jgi:acetyltransferase
VDGILVTLSPQGMTDPAATAELLKPFAAIPGKPLLASWMGGEGVEKGREILKAAGIPSFPFPDTAALAFNYMWQYSRTLRALYETPKLIPELGDRAAAADILESAKALGRTLLPEADSKRLLAGYGIPIVRTEVARSEPEAVRLAAEIGYPVALKLHSHTITHKTDVGGVELNLRDESAVRAAWQRIQAGITALGMAEHFQGVTVQQMVETRDAYELILGSSVDAQFGPVILFGAGGQLVEVFRDRALGLPPLNSTLARLLMEQTRIYKALGGVRGRKPVDRHLMEQILVRFSQLVAEQPRIREIDINPLLASPEGIVALDARIVLHDWSIADDRLPRLSIRPYPSEYVETFTLRDGSEVTMRPIRPEDEPAMVSFHEALSDRSVYLRYFHHLSLSERVSHERLTRICFGDYDRMIVLVAENAQGAIVAVGRLNREPGASSAEFALLVGDPWQHSGIGRELLNLLIRIARLEKIQRIYGPILAQNQPMLDICRELSFHLKYVREEAAFEASLET